VERDERLDKNWKRSQWQRNPNEMKQESADRTEPRNRNFLIPIKSLTATDKRKS
jgi:hypothetical protein